MTLCNCFISTKMVEFSKCIAEFVRIIIEIKVKSDLNQICFLFIKAKSLIIRLHNCCLHSPIKYINNVIDDTVKKNCILFLLIF